jgi:hypothetical protein
LQGKNDFTKSIVSRLKRKFVANVNNSHITEGSLKITNDFAILTTTTKGQVHSCWYFLRVDEVTLKNVAVQKSHDMHLVHPVEECG